MPGRKWENFFLKQGFKFIAGIDEVGRGPLAGPVVAAAVILPQAHPIKGINDSKKLKEKDRQRLYQNILKHAIAIGVGIVDHEMIDKINIAQATYAAMRLAVESLDPTPDILLIDGNCGIGHPTPQQCIVKGDSRCQSIAAASIIAKVIRDGIMEEYDKIFPKYRFKKHKGYGTKLHFKLIKDHGLSPIHRRSFNFISKNSLDFEPLPLINFNQLKS